MSNHPRVLVVEDDPLVLMMTILDLQADGFDVVGAESMGEAHRLVKAGELDAVVIDLDLRGGDGFALALTARSRNPAVGVIYTSGVSQSDFEARRVKGGLLVAKPTVTQELARRLRELLA